LRLCRRSLPSLLEFAICPTSVLAWEQLALTVLSCSFIFNFLGRIHDVGFSQIVFDEPWSELLAELADPSWTFFAVCNLKNLRSPDDSLTIGDGVEIRSRRYEALTETLGWTEDFIEATIARVWHEGGFW
jgi:hypothetical protein